VRTLLAFCLFFCSFQKKTNNTYILPGHFFCFVFIFVFCAPGDWTRSLGLPREGSHTSALSFFISLFFDRLLLLPRGTRDCDLPTYVSQVAGVTSMCRDAQLVYFTFAMESQGEFYFCKWIQLLNFFKCQEVQKAKKPTEAALETSGTSRLAEVPKPPHTDSARVPGSPTTNSAVNCKSTQSNKLVCVPALHSAVWKKGLSLETSPSSSSSHKSLGQVQEDSWRRGTHEARWKGQWGTLDR
jgi:hypothetical protein